jgi:sigma-E factor negative regulatory protein RseB
MTPTADPRRAPGRRVGRRLLLALALLVAGDAGAASSPEALDWVKRASQAVDEHSFVADVVYEQGTHIEALRLWRDAGREGRSRERLMTLSGPPREILRHESTTTYIAPGATDAIEQRYAHRSVRLPRPESVSRLENAYILNREGADRVAGRKAERIRLIPRDDRRYGHLLWIDHGTGVVLRADVLADEGQPVERFMVVDLRFRETLEQAQLEPALSGSGASFKRIAPAEPVAGSGPGLHDEWSVETPPTGFTLEADRQQPLPGHDQPVRHLLYTDGMASISVYLRQRDAAERLEGAMTMGGVNIHARVHGDTQILVVGQVPAATVEHMATALVRTN